MSHNCATWLHAGFDRDSREAIIRMAINQLTGEKFDTIVFSGVSGAIIAPVIAYQLNKEIVVIRKPGSDTHSTNKIFEGYELSQRYIIVDDIVSTGKTIARIAKEMRTYTNSRLHGLFMYSRASSIRGFTSIDKPTGNAVLDQVLHQIITEQIGRELL